MGSDKVMHLYPIPSEREVYWRRDRRLVRRGFRDLEYLPLSRTGRNATLVAHVYSTRRRIAHAIHLNQWAVMHGCPASSQYSELGENALVL